MTAHTRRLSESGQQWVGASVLAGQGTHPVSGRQIAGVMGHQGAAWLDRQEREQEEAPTKAVAALRLKPGQVVADITERVPMPMQGHVTSSYFSANLKRSIALALVQNGRNRMGEKVRVSMPGGRALIAAITNPVFLDPEGARQNV